MSYGISRLCMLIAGPTFAFGLFLMQPQINALAELDGVGSFMKSLALEGDSWRSGHIVLVFAALSYIGAGIGAGAVIARRNAWVGGAISILFVVGFAGLVGNFSLDFVFGSLASSLEENAAQSARMAILSDSATQILFVQGGAMVMLLGMSLLSISTLIMGWTPRLAGVFIVAGWTVTIGLNSVIPYAEVLGHFMVGIGFWVIASMSSQNN